MPAPIISPWSWTEGGAAPPTPPSVAVGSVYRRALRVILLFFGGMG